MSLTEKTAAKIIQSRSLVTQPGSYELQVSNVTPFNDKFIVNYKAMTPYHVSEAKRLAKEDDFDAAANQNISSSQRATDYIPSKGEFVKVQMDYVTTKSGKTGLFVVAVSPTKAMAKGKISNIFDEEFAEEITAQLGDSQAVTGK